MPRTASDAIAEFNAGREPERLALKYKAMRTNAFGFLRGSCHLFHERLAGRKLAPDDPKVWICGDLHLENFGSYLGDNGLTYFDVNDFDEAVRAPHSWDIVRLATSMLVAAPVIGVKPAAAKGMAQRLIEGYFAELAIGKPRWIERRTASGPIGALIEGLKKRDDAKYLDKRSVVKAGGRRQLIVDGVKTLAISMDDRALLKAFMDTTGKNTPNPKAMALVDAARRVAGTGSLGIARFVLLVEGHGSPGGNWLIDLKSAQPSALAPYAPDQPAWPNEAARVVAVQTLFQANTPGMLSAHRYGGAPFVLKQMQPTADRLDLTAIAAANGMDAVIDTMARLTAWGHLRGTGRYGAATADELISAAGDAKAPRDLFDRTQTMADITAADYTAYAASYDAGRLAA